MIDDDNAELPTEENADQSLARAFSTGELDRFAGIVDARANETAQQLPIKSRLFWQYGPLIIAVLVLFAALITERELFGHSYPWISIAIFIVWAAGLYILDTQKNGTISKESTVTIIACITFSVATGFAPGLNLDPEEPAAPRPPVLSVEERQAMSHFFEAYKLLQQSPNLPQAKKAARIAYMKSILDESKLVPDAVLVKFEPSLASRYKLEFQRGLELVISALDTKDEKKMEQAQSLFARFDVFISHIPFLQESRLKPQ